MYNTLTAAACTVLTFLGPGCEERTIPGDSGPTPPSVQAPPEEPPDVLMIGDHRIELVRMEPGRFEMGEPNWRTAKVLEFLSATPAGSNEGPPHTVEITYPFWISKEPISAEMYSEFLNSLEPEIALREFVSLNKFANFELREGRFVTRQASTSPYANTVSHAGAVTFCEWLEKQVPFTVRLPYEAEWEYAGKVRGDELRYGLNLWEYCRDFYRENYEPDGEVTFDPRGPKQPVENMDDGRVAFVHRFPNEIFTDRLPANHHPPVRDGVFGFRIIVLPSEATEEPSD